MAQKICVFRTEVDRVCKDLGEDDHLRENAFCLNSSAPMSVPSLSWQMFGVLYKMASIAKKTSFLPAAPAPA